MINVELLKQVKILVIGDIMLDEFIFGEVNRISPEAPVPIVKIDSHTKAVPGGAANTANNIKSLGGSVKLISVIGEDESSKRLNNTLRNYNIDQSFIREKGRYTTTKRRIYATSQGCQQQILRIDIEDTRPILNTTQNKINDLLPVNIKASNCVVLSDYNKGLLTEKLCQVIINLCNKDNIPIVVDPKPSNISRFINCSLITPNLFEAQKISGIENSDEESLKKIIKKIKQKLKCKYVVITLGKNGICYEEGGEFNHIHTVSKKVIDVTGAGDTVTAVLALCLGAKLDLAESVNLANNAANKVVEKFGTATISFSELFNK